MLTRYSMGFMHLIFCFLLIVLILFLKSTISNKCVNFYIKSFYCECFLCYNEFIVKNSDSTNEGNEFMHILWNLDYVKIKESLKEKIIFSYLLYIFIIGIYLSPIDELFYGLYKIMITPGILLTDYMVVSGIGCALVNGSLVGMIGFFILKLNKVSLSGPSIAVIFTMTGFGFFGKNPASVFPVILGTFIYSKFKKHKFRIHIFPALFGTSLVPLMSQVTFTYEWGFIAGTAVGILSGFIISPLSTHLLRSHEGYNLYNVGFAAGFVGLLFVAIFKNYGFETSSVLILGSEFNEILKLIFIPMFISMIICGTILCKNDFKNYIELIKHPGILISDFPNFAGFASTLINMGLVGIIGTLYIYIVDGDYNGPTAGALLTMVGFAAFGKHPLNITPIMFGVYLGTLSNMSEFNANDPTALLAALFGTTLAPLAGRFGIIVGILAGFVHLCVVSNVGMLHGNLNLYNNGFSGGIVATIFVSIIHALKKD